VGPSGESPVGPNFAGDSPARAAGINGVNSVSPAGSEERRSSAVTGIGVSAAKKDVDNVHAFQGGL
jgi:hypothetical protein